ncbi:hypothetical protein HYH02_008245 [Chlamydomonas schloesseri]|uniref:Uncharacterized protein n=1 Tax=Chlamydomonas schloesseri TaxID=2026947 RepID=A0A836B3N9_9CHLO|nr:hypothetical protein HYH02_008245 [Chlamydomonas schloesseri]|eukprot:KAG2446677.1 hypothetical protein HYH02_008245 [Chlamydomonas schloesseri]
MATICPLKVAECGYVTGRAEKSVQSTSSTGGTRPLPFTGSSGNLLATAAEAFSSIVRQQSRDASPGGANVPGRRSQTSGSFALDAAGGEPAPSRSVSTLSAEDGQAPDTAASWAVPSAAAHSAPRAPRIDLASCPSFQEQRGSKPVFLDRHQTLQRVTEETANALQAAATLAELEVAEAEEQAAAFEAAANAAAAASINGAEAAAQKPHVPAQNQRCPYLPGWDISQSSVWNQLEQAVLRNILLEELYGNPSQQHHQQQQHRGGAEATKQREAAAAVSPAALHNAHVHAQHLLVQHERRQSFPRGSGGGGAGGSPAHSSPASPLCGATAAARSAATPVGFSEPNPFASQYAHSVFSPVGTMMRESPGSPACAPAAAAATTSAGAAVTGSPSILSRPHLPPHSPARLGASAGTAAATAPASHAVNVLGSFSDAGATAAAAGMTVLNDIVREVLLQRSDTLDRPHDRQDDHGHRGELRGLGPDCPALVPSTSFGRARSLLRHVSRRWGAANGSFGCSSLGRSSFGRDSSVLQPAGSSTSNASGGADGGSASVAAGSNPFAAALRSAASHVAASFSGSGAAVAGVAAVSSVTAAVAVGGSAALQLGGHALADGADLLMNRVQGTVVGKISALAADAVLGKGASRSARRAFRQRLRAAAAGVSIAFFLANHMAVTDTLISFDLEHDFVTSAKTMLDLVTSAPQLMENVRELMQIGVAVTMGAAQRGAVAAAAAGAMGDAAQEAAAAGQEGVVGELLAMAESVAAEAQDHN